VVIADEIKFPEEPTDLAGSVGIIERKFTSQFTNNAYVNALKEQADIEDNRLIIY